MTIRTTILGGTSWNDGEILSHTDLNSTITALAPCGFDLTGGTNATVGISEVQLGSDINIPAGLATDTIRIQLSVKGYCDISGNPAKDQYIQYHIYHYDNVSTETLIETLIPIRGASYIDLTAKNIENTLPHVLISTDYNLSSADKSGGCAIRIKASQNKITAAGTQTATWHNCVIYQLVS